jgi:hypothetical protein
MVPHVDTDTLLVELDQRHHLATMHRLATECDRTHIRDTGRLRWALGSVLLRLGAVVLGDDELMRSNAVSGG